MKANHTPLPSIESARKVIVRHVVRGAVETYNEALRAEDEAKKTFYYEDDKLDPMYSVVYERVTDARLTLIRAILGISPSGGVEDCYRAEMCLCHPRGVALGNLIYMVVPDATQAADMELGERAKDDADPVMTLTVLDRSAVEDMDDAAPIHDLDPKDVPPAPEAEEAEDEPTEIRAPREEVPRPLLRQSLTIVPPWDNGSDATLQVIVLADGTHLDDVTAGRSDVPELAEAGWIAHSMKGLQVHFRVVG